MFKIGDSMFTLRYRKSRDNLSSSDVKLSSRICIDKTIILTMYTAPTKFNLYSLLSGIKYVHVFFSVSLYMGLCGIFSVPFSVFSVLLGVFSVHFGSFRCL